MFETASQEEIDICLNCPLKECNGNRRCLYLERMRRKGGEKRMRKELKLLRVANGLNQSQMAKKMDVSLSTYNLIEQGKRQGSQAFWMKLQQEFNLDGGTAWRMQNPQTCD